MNHRRAGATRIASVLLAAALLAGCGWAQHRAGSAGTGFNPGETTITPGNVAQLELAWSKAVSWTVPTVDTAAPIVRSGADVVVASAGHSAVLDAETGALRRNIGGSDDHSVAVSDGRIFVTGFQGGQDFSHVTVFDQATGVGQWTTEEQFDVTAPIVDDGVLHYVTVSRVGTHDHGVRSRRASDGKVLWDTSSCCGDVVAPSIANGTLFYVQVFRGSPTMLSAFDAVDGTPRWSVPATRCTAATATVVAGGRVYTGGSTFDAATGAHLWDWPRCPIVDLPTVSSTTVYVPYRPLATTVALQAFDAATGAKRGSIPWGLNASGEASAPAVANGILFGADGNQLVADDARTGERLWTSPASSGNFSDPIVSDGMVYAMNTDGSAYAFSLPS